MIKVIFRYSREFYKFFEYSCCGLLNSAEKFAFSTNSPLRSTAISSAIVETTGRSCEIKMSDEPCC